MLIVTKEQDIINSRPGDDYFDRVKLFIVEWLEGKPALHVKTSGSTGLPKEMEISRKQIEASVEQTAKAFHLNSETLFVCNLSLDFIAGKLQIIRALELGAELMVLHPSEDWVSRLMPHRTVFLRNSGKNFFAFVPLQLQKILENETGKELLNTASAIILGGTSVPSALQKDVNELRVPVYATFGMTETITHFALKRINGDHKDLYFKTLPGTAIKLSDSGQLMVKNPCTSNLWLTTNDRAKIHPDDSFEILGRLDRVINSGGVKLALDEIEGKIDELISLSVPFFCEGLPDQKLGQKLVLFVESEEDLPHLLPFLKSNMPKFEAPKEVICLRNFLRTATGKIDKRKTTDAYSVSNQ